MPRVTTPRPEKCRTEEREISGARVSSFHRDIRQVRLNEDKGLRQEKKKKKKERNINLVLRVHPRLCDRYVRHRVQRVTRATVIMQKCQACCSNTEEGRGSRKFCGDFIAAKLEIGFKFFPGTAREANEDK